MITVCKHVIDIDHIDSAHITHGTVLKMKHMGIEEVLANYCPAISICKYIHPKQNYHE